MNVIIPLFSQHRNGDHACSFQQDENLLHAKFIIVFKICLRFITSTLSSSAEAAGHHDHIHDVVFHTWSNSVSSCTADDTTRTAQHDRIQFKLPPPSTIAGVVDATKKVMPHARSWIMVLKCDITPPESCPLSKEELQVEELPLMEMILPAQTLSAEAKQRVSVYHTMKST
jgi:hypothetical protein